MPSKSGKRVGAYDIPLLLYPFVFFIIIIIITFHNNSYKM